MSQRALKKRDLLNAHKQEKEVTAQLYRKQTQPVVAHKIHNAQRLPHRTATTTPATTALTQANDVDRPNDSDANSLITSTRKYHSTPNLTVVQLLSSDLIDKVVRSLSEADLAKLPVNENKLVNARSEFHLKSIASTEVPLLEQRAANRYGGRNERSASRSLGTASSQSIGQQSQQQQQQLNAMQPKRMSLQSGLSATSAYSMTSSASDSTQPPTSGFVDVDSIRIPIIGYEVMEERARFTVYKLRVENPFTNDCWLVLRRYTDFQRLNTKLKTQFPQLAALTLPRKKLFGDNFSSLFLSNRVQGLQIFINAVMASDTLRASQIVRDFFCLDEPPVYSESVEECRAIFEAQEETIAHLKMQLRAKDELIVSLQQQVTQEVERNRSLSSAINMSYDNCLNCSKLFDDLTMKKNG